MSSTVTIRLTDLQAEAHVGVHPWEKHAERPARLLVTVALEMELAAYYAAGGYINYDPIHAHLRAWRTRPHTEHLETLAENFLDFVFASTPAERCALSIEKPDIFADVDRVGVRYDVTRGDWKKLR